MRFELSTKYKLSKEILDNFKKITLCISEMEEIDENVFFEINIINNELIQKINKNYRKIDKPTDVLSFSMWENQSIKTALLGEIYISYDQAKIQAREYEHSFEREICFLLIHGIFHLLGYDHIQKEDEKIMFAKQKIVMKNLAILKKG